VSTIHADMRLAWIPILLLLPACGDDGGDDDTGNDDSSSATDPSVDDDGTTAADDDDDDDDATDPSVDDDGTISITDDGTSVGDDADTTADSTDDDGTTGTAACGAEIERTAWPTSGYYIHFVAADEHAHLWVDNEDAIAYVDTWLIKPDVPLGIPGGPIELESELNPGYSYRLVPSEVTFAEVWTEVCDAAPCYVEADAAAWLANPGDWCPWTFQPVEIWDCRDGDGTSCVPAYP
jgi:hypothetical protein